jgi:hypothetical protein
MQKSLKENSKREQQVESSLSHILDKCFIYVQIKSLSPSILCTVQRKWKRWDVVFVSHIKKFTAQNTPPQKKEKNISWYWVHGGLSNNFCSFQRRQTIALASCVPPWERIKDCTQLHSHPNISHLTLLPTTKTHKKRKMRRRLATLLLSPSFFYAK